MSKEAPKTHELLKIRYAPIDVFFTYQLFVASTTLSVPNNKSQSINSVKLLWS